jgi:hypothetical protein
MNATVQASDGCPPLKGEERLPLAKNCGATIFVGVACLYGNSDCTDSRNRYPT